jgi:hypothetical protein
VPAGAGEVGAVARRRRRISPAIRVDDEENSEADAEFGSAQPTAATIVPASSGRRARAARRRQFPPIPDPGG